MANSLGLILTELDSCVDSLAQRSSIKELKAIEFEDVLS